MGDWKARWLALTVCAALGGVACDEAPPPPPPPPAAAKTPAGPTTQELAEGPRKTIDLQSIPFTIDAPPGWELGEEGTSPGSGIIMLHGPLIGGDSGHVVFGHHDDVTPQAMKSLIDHIRRDAPAIEKAGGVVLVHDVGDIRIVERREMPPATAPTTAPLPQPMNLCDPPLPDLALDAPVQWRVSLFVPAGVDYEQYELQFIDITQTSFAKNQQLLSDMVASLKYLDPAHPPQ